jgi:hypothetical protein
LDWNNIPFNIYLCNSKLTIINGIYLVCHSFEVLYKYQLMVLIIVYRKYLCRIYVLKVSKKSLDWCKKLWVSFSKIVETLINIFR